MKDEVRPPHASPFILHPSSLILPPIGGDKPPSPRSRQSVLDHPPDALIRVNEPLHVRFLAFAVTSHEPRVTSHFRHHPHVLRAAAHGKEQQVAGPGCTIRHALAHRLDLPLEPIRVDDPAVVYVLVVRQPDVVRRAEEQPDTIKPLPRTPRMDKRNVQVRPGRSDQPFLYTRCLSPCSPCPPWLMAIDVTRTAAVPAGSACPFRGHRAPLSY